MKSKITRGKGFRGCLDYAFDVGPKATHDKDAELIGGNMCGENPRELAHEFSAVRAIRPDVEKPVWHSSLRCPAGENPSDEQWNAIAKDYMQRLGFDTDKTPYCIIRHKDNHIHIVASRVDLDGGLYLGKNEHLKATRITQELEKEHGLTITKGPEYTIDEDGKERVKMPDRKKPSSKELKMMERTGELSPKQKLQNIIDEAVKDRPTAEEYEKRLEEAGVEWRKGSAGYSYSIEGHAYKGSQLGDAYKGERFKGRLDLWQEPEKAPAQVREPVAIQTPPTEKTPETRVEELKATQIEVDGTRERLRYIIGEINEQKKEVYDRLNELNAEERADREKAVTGHEGDGYGPIVQALWKLAAYLDRIGQKLIEDQRRLQRETLKRELDEINKSLEPLKEELRITNLRLQNIKLELTPPEKIVERYDRAIYEVMERDFYRPLDQRIEQAEAKVDALRAERDRLDKAIEQKEKSWVAFGLKDLKEEKKRTEKALDDAYGDRAAAKHAREEAFGRGAAEAKAKTEVATKLGPDFMSVHRRAVNTIEAQHAANDARRKEESRQRAIEFVKREKDLTKGKGIGD